MPSTDLPVLNLSWDTDTRLEYACTISSLWSLARKMTRVLVVQPSEAVRITIMSGEIFI